MCKKKKDVKIELSEEYVQKAKEVAQSLNLIDDSFFQVFAEDQDAVEELLQILLNAPDLKLVEVHPQESLKNIAGRSVILDALAQFSNGKLCNIEVQKSDKDDHQRRVRYNAACVTTAFAEKGIEFMQIPDVIVVYISKFDIFESGYAVYHVDRVLRETGDKVTNGFEEVFVNTAVDDGTVVSELMKYFLNTNGFSDSFKKISSRCMEIKDEKGDNNMCEAVDNLMKEVAQDVKEDTLKMVIRNMHDAGMALSEIAKIACVNEEFVEEVLK